MVEFLPFILEQNIMFVRKKKLMKFEREMYGEHNLSKLDVQ